MKRALAALAALCGCGQDCPGDPVEVRRYTGPDIEGTAITCDGVPNWTPCQYPDISGIVTQPSPDGCDGVWLSLGGGSLSGHDLSIWLVGDDEVEVAFVAGVYACDNEPCPDRGWTPVVDGYVAVQEFSHHGRNRGEFEIEYADVTISGTYDATPR